MLKDYVYKGILKWIGSGFIVESSAGQGVHLVSNSDTKFLKYLAKDRNSVFEVAYYMETYGPFNYAHIIIPDNLFEMSVRAKISKTVNPDDIVLVVGTRRFLFADLQVYEKVLKGINQSIDFDVEIERAQGLYSYRIIVPHNLFESVCTKDIYPLAGL